MPFGAPENSVQSPQRPDLYVSTLEKMPGPSYVCIAGKARMNANLRPDKSMKTGFLSLLGLSLLLTDLPAAVLAQDTNAAPPPAKPASAVQKPKTVQRFSAGLDDVVRLTKAGVDEAVILAYVQSSSIAYRPNAQEIVRLRELNVTSGVITAMLKRGDDLRERAAAARREAQQKAPPPAPAAPAPQAPPANDPQPTQTSTTTQIIQPVVYQQPVYYPEYRSSSVIYFPASYSYYNRYASYFPSSYGNCYPRYSYYSSYGSCYPRYGYGGNYGGYGLRYAGYRNCW